MNKKLLSIYLVSVLALIVFGYLADLGTVNGLVSLLSLYIAIRFLYYGFRKDKSRKFFYYSILIYLIFVTFFGSVISFGVADLMNSPNSGFIAQIIIGSLLNIIPFAYFLIFAQSDSVVQKTRCWYFVLAPVVEVSISLMFVYL